jgi:putative component of membrane protein insertase Oxa1/YidC/SpoIIIJ protein YidD
MRPARVFARVALGCAVCAAAPIAAAQEADVPFEPARAHAAARPEEDGPSGFSPAADVLLPLIGVYREHIGPASIRRCPFAVSCSAFARDAIERHGLFGLLLFFDRYLFRENPDAWRHYGVVRVEDGTLRLDDAVR